MITTKNQRSNNLFFSDFLFAQNFLCVFCLSKEMFIKQFYLTMNEPDGEEGTEGI